MILNRLEYERLYARSMKDNSERFVKRLNYLIPIVANTAEDAIPDDIRHFINELLRGMDKFYGRKNMEGRSET